MIYIYQFASWWGVLLLVVGLLPLLLVNIFKPSRSM